MGKGRNNTPNGRHPHDDDYDNRYVNNHYIYDDEYDDAFFANDETEIDDHDYYQHGTPRRSSQLRSGPLPPAYPRSRYDRQGAASRPTASQHSRHSRKRDWEQERGYRVVREPKRHSIWSGIFVGCLISLLLLAMVVAALLILGYNTLNGGGSLSHLPSLLNSHTYTKTETQQVNITQLQQLTICDATGNISVMVDPTATKTTVVAQKSVQSSSQSDANQQLQAMTVAIQPPTTITTPLTCKQVATQATPASTPSSATQTTPTAISNNPTAALTINVTFPRQTNENVDLTVTLPPSAIQGSSPSLPVAVESRQGNITLNGLSGILRVHNVNGNVAISHAVLADGSQIDTGQGNITFSGYLLLPVAAATNDTGSTDTQQARYILRNEKGNINVTLPANTNLTLDANTNIGTITSAFKTAITSSGNGDGPVNVHAPLNPTAGNPPPATLVLDVSTGNVYIQKATS